MNDFNFYLACLEFLEKRRKDPGNLELAATEASLKEQATTLGLPCNFEAMEAAADEYGYLDVDWNSSSFNC